MIERTKRVGVSSSVFRTSDNSPKCQLASNRGKTPPVPGASAASGFQEVFAPPAIEVGRDALAATQLRDALLRHADPMPAALLRSGTATRPNLLGRVCLGLDLARAVALASGQGEEEFCAFAQLGLHADISAVGTHDLLAERQPDARPGCCGERLVLGET